MTVPFNKRTYKRFAGVGSVGAEQLTDQANRMFANQDRVSGPKQKKKYTQNTHGQFKRWKPKAK